MRTERGQRVAAAWAVRGQPYPAVGAELPVSFDLTAAITALLHELELVASFVHRSNLLKSWEKTEICEGSASGAYRPKNVAITRISAPYAATESHHFSDRTALV